jgi:hypothetical protein
MIRLLPSTLTGAAIHRKAEKERQLADRGGVGRTVGEQPIQTTARKPDKP